MPDKVFIDTNVLVYAHDSSLPDKRRISQELILGHMREGAAVISPQVLGEFFITATKKSAKPLSESQAKKEILLLSSLATVDIDATLVVRALEIKGKWRLNYWDSLIVAAAERGGCKILYSEDMADGQSYGSVTVRNPYKHARC